MTSVYHRRFYPRRRRRHGRLRRAERRRSTPRTRATTGSSGRSAPTRRAGPRCWTLQKEALGRAAPSCVARVQAAAAADGPDVRRDDRHRRPGVRDDRCWTRRGRSGSTRRRTTARRCPPATATTETIYDWIDRVAGSTFYTDQGLDPYIPYYYQAGTQLGWPQPRFSAPARAARATRACTAARRTSRATIPMRFDPLRDARHRPVGAAAGQPAAVRLRRERPVGRRAVPDLGRARATRTGTRCRAATTDRTSPSSRRGAADGHGRAAALGRRSRAAPQLRTSGTGYIPELDDYNPGLDRSLPF